MKRFHSAATATLVLSASSLALAQDLQPPPPLTGAQDQQQPQPQPQQVQPQVQPQPQPVQLTPPPPIQQQPPTPQATEQRLEDSKKEDSGRGLEFLFLNAQIGGVYDALGTFSSTLQLQQTNGGGPMVGAEVGVRFVWLTLGARFRYEMLQPFNIWQLNAVVGFHVPAGSWDPYVSVHGGYSAIGSIDPNNFNASQIAPGSSTQDAANAFSSKGANVGFAIGADYYFARFISIGVEGAFELIFLHRDPLPIPYPSVCDATCQAAAQAAVASNPLYSASGDAAGVGLVASAHLALHL